MLGRCGGAGLRFGVCGANRSVNLCHYSSLLAGPLNRCSKSSRSWPADVGGVCRRKGKTTFPVGSLTGRTRWHQQSSPFSSQLWRLERDKNLKTGIYRTQKCRVSVFYLVSLQPFIHFLQRSYTWHGFAWRGELCFCACLVSVRACDVRPQRYIASLR